MCTNVAFIVKVELSIWFITNPAIRSTGAKNKPSLHLSLILQGLRNELVYLLDCKVLEMVVGPQFEPAPAFRAVEIDKTACNSVGVILPCGDDVAVQPCVSSALAPVREHERMLFAQDFELCESRLMFYK